MACWSTKAAVYLKRVNKIEEKLLWRAYRKSQTLFRTVPSPTTDPLRPPLPEDWGFTTPPKTAIAIISITAKATDCKFGWCIHRVHPNTSPWKILEKRERGRIQRRPKFFWVPHIISGTCKATNFKFCRYIQRVYAKKSPLKIWEKRERGRIQGLPKFFEYPLLSQEWLKLRISNLAGIFTGPYEQKTVKNLWEKGAWAYPGTAEIFWVPSGISGKLRTSNLADIFTGSMRTKAH